MMGLDPACDELVEFDQPVLGRSHLGDHLVNRHGPQDAEAV
jgi:hypothetical protein